MTLISPIQSPGSIVMGQWSKEPCQETYLRRLQAYVKGKRDLPLVDPTAPPPNTILFPTLEDLENFTATFTLGEYDAVSVDIENAGPHIICIGFTHLSLSSGRVGTTLCLRFRHRGGSIYWTKRSELLQVVDWLYRLLDSPGCGKVFHNGVVYDVPILRDLGFSVRGRLIDTLNLQHACYPEMSKGLQFCATLYLWSPCWKLLTDETDEGDGKG